MTQELRLNFNRIARVKQWYQNNTPRNFKDPLAIWYTHSNTQQAYDERFYIVKTNYDHLARVLASRFPAENNIAGVRPIVQPQNTIPQPTFFQNLISELNCRIGMIRRRLNKYNNPYYKTNTFKW